jgi:hypothetical protein
LQIQKGVIRGRKPKNDRHEGFADAQGVIRGCTPKNNIQVEIENTKGVIKGRKTEEGHARRV